MKHSYDTYRLYSDEKIFTFSVRVKVTMKEEVDIDVLRHAVNVAIRRYPYFAVHRGSENLTAHFLMVRMMSLRLICFQTRNRFISIRVKSLW